MRFLILTIGLFLCVSLNACIVNKSNGADDIPTAEPVPQTVPHPAANTSRTGVSLRGKPLAIPSRPPREPLCAAACVMDATTGRVLFSHNGNQRRQVASTQKILTALVVLERNDLDKRITVQPADTKAEPTKLGLKAGQRYLCRDLLRAMMIRSYNDVALTLARDTAGSVSEFANLMNAKARSLGMHNSHFVNPNGLPANQYSTAIDMARCAYYAYRQPELVKITRLQDPSFKLSSGKTIRLHNTNKLLSRIPWVNGMKTGYTNAAGRCLITTANKNGYHVIVVVLGCKPANIWNESQKLLEWALGEYS